MTMHIYPVEKAPKASAQQRELYEGKGLAGEAYRASCEALWALLDKGARPHSLKGTPFEYLARKFNNLREESKLKPGRLDPVFRDWFVFAYHVGPRPSDKHQLDRINDSDNYRVGNVRWLHAKRQNSNKRLNRPHVYKGKRFTDSELSALLAKHGKSYNHEAIKKYRQRMGIDGYSNEEITREIFKRFGISYESSGDPLEDADFSPKYYKKLSEAYRISGSGLTRIEFEIAWLREKLAILKKNQQDEMGLVVILKQDESYKLLCRISDIEDDLKAARKREQSLKVEKVNKDIEDTEPETCSETLTTSMNPHGITHFEKKKLIAAF